jgi:hypothetical protein
VLGAVADDLRVWTTDHSLCIGLTKRRADPAESAQ